MFSIFLLSFFVSTELKALFWWFGGGVTPVLIPNTAVKPSCADGTRKGRVGHRQNRAFNTKQSAERWAVLHLSEGLHPLSFRQSEPGQLSLSCADGARRAPDFHIANAV